MEPFEYAAHLHRQELRAQAAAQRLARECRRSAIPPVVVRLYARLWWASRPRVRSWTPALFDAPAGP